MSRVAIITGASSGIGEATARRLAHDGICVTVAARRREELERVAKEIKAAGGQALAAPTDVRDRAAIHRMVEATLTEWGRVDVLVNNAGLDYGNRVVNLDPNQLREEVDVNLIAVVECAQAVLPAMMQQKSGHIINVASIAGLVGLPGSSVYCATKFAVVGFSDALRREVLRYGIHVTAFCPGFVATKFSPRLKQISEGRPDRERLPGVMRVDYVADCIAGIIWHPRRRVIIPLGWGMLAWIAQAFPWLTDFVLSRYVEQAE
jgi:NADP-dependent 3-hydroxy acid dehydrogenase YdfG